MSELAENLSWEDIEYEKHREKLQEIMTNVLRSGTDEPHCFLDEGLLRSRLHLFQDNFLPDDPTRRIIYAMKANPRRRIMSIFTEEGIDGFDCASPPEIERALNVNGVDPNGIYYNNPVKSKSDIQRALTDGVSYYTAQSRSGVEQILSQNLFFENPDLEVAVRVETPNPQARIDLSTKFGCSPEEGSELVKRIKASGARAGLAMHTGSQNGSSESFTKGLEILQEVAKRSGGVSSINIGGGFPVNYLPSQQFVLKEYLDEVTSSIKQIRSDILTDIAEGPRVIVEPGRALVAPAVDLAVPVLEINTHHGERRVYLNDGIFTSFLSMLAHDWHYDFEVFPRDGRSFRNKPSSCSLYGRTCDSGDTLGKVNLPADLKEGDYLHVRYAGAYMDCQATRFNGFGPPKYVSYN